jgi:hypothetical protein
MVIKYLFLPLKKRHGFCMPTPGIFRIMHTHAVHVYTVHAHTAHAPFMHAHVLHAHPVNTHAMQCLFYGRIYSDMPTVAIGHYLVAMDTMAPFTLPLKCHLTNRAYRDHFDNDMPTVKMHILCYFFLAVQFLCHLL